MKTTSRMMRYVKETKKVLVLSQKTDLLDKE